MEITNVVDHSSMASEQGVGVSQGSKLLKIHLCDSAARNIHFGGVFRKHFLVAYYY